MVYIFIYFYIMRYSKRIILLTVLFTLYLFLKLNMGLSNINFIWTSIIFLLYRVLGGTLQLAFIFSFFLTVFSGLINFFEPKLFFNRYDVIWSLLCLFFIYFFDKFFLGRSEFYFLSKRNQNK